MDRCFDIPPDGDRSSEQLLQKHVCAECCYLRMHSLRLEIGCCDALAIPEINRFKEDVNAGFRQAGKTAIDFGSGLWQRILEIRDSRHEYAHSGVSVSDRFPSVSVAENAIAKIREAIRDICTRAGKQIPAWANLDASDGWPQTRGFGTSAHLTVLRRPIDKNDPNVFNISLVTPTGEGEGNNLASRRYARRGRYG